MLYHVPTTSAPEFCSAPNTGVLLATPPATPHVAAVSQGTFAPPEPMSPATPSAWPRPSVSVADDMPSEARGVGSQSVTGTRIRSKIKAKVVLRLGEGG